MCVSVSNMFAYILPEGIKIDAYMYMHGALVYKSYVQQIILNSI